ncbi:MAG: hypothetical protein DRJ56_00230 [Thermoprotei archaeon]|nr:MAG: hypothetical protein DRJ56_00230 [Thermoprotei archaeon]
MELAMGAGWRTYSLLLSGEHPTLPLAEVLAILEAEGVPFEVLSRDGRLVRLRAKGLLDSIERRAALCHMCCAELASGEGGAEDVLEAAKGIDWSFLDGKTFSVRVYKCGALSRVSGASLERAVGEVVAKRSRGRVRLLKPDVEVVVIVTSKSFSIGTLLFRVDRRGLAARRPRLRPFFRPSSLDSKLARALVNLSRCRPGDVVLDPFAGSGSIGVEAALLGCYSVNLDLDEEMVSGCALNMAFYDVEAGDVARADSLLWPLREQGVDRIVTDLPYGRTSSTHGRTRLELVSGLLSLAGAVLRGGGVAVFMHERGLEVEDLVSDAGARLIDQHEIRVHGGLTRVVRVVAFD